LPERKPLPVAPHAVAVVGDTLALPYADDTFGRVFTGHFYEHLGPEERACFLGEAGRAASELVVVDSAVRLGVEPGAVAGPRA